MPETVPDAAFESAKRQFLQGLDHFEAGRFHDAEASFRGSLAAVPGRVSTLVNLSATLLALGRADEALALADEVLAQEADNHDAEFHRATALGRLQRKEESLQAFERVLRLNDGWGEAWSRHGQMLQSLGRHGQALDSYRRAVAVDEQLPLAWLNLGSLLRESGQAQEAASAFRQAIRHGADTELVRYYLASVTAGDGGVPTAPPRSYVQSLFDNYAEGFDTHLVLVLGYKTHEILVQHLRALAPGRRFDDALDLGCGTGLCGRLVRPSAQRLAGVDLSQAMLDKAAATQVYDALAQGDIVEHLQAAEPSRHDLVLATDVFIYLGDLGPTFAAVHRAMRPGGLFCFSAEVFDDPAPAGGPGFELRPSLRYAHSEPYLRGLAERHGFEVAQLVREPLREEQRQAVMGLFVYLRRR